MYIYIRVCVCVSFTENGDGRLFGLSADKLARTASKPETEIDIICSYIIY